MTTADRHIHPYGAVRRPLSLEAPVRAGTGTREGKLDDVLFPLPCIQTLPIGPRVPR
jgi:hypothetical protein